jgi:hypothetical protein
MVMGAWLVSTGLRETPGRGRLLGAGRLLVALALVGITWWSVAILGGFEDQVNKRAVFDGPMAMANSLARHVSGLQRSPPIDSWAESTSTGGRALTRWIYECTDPGDRLLVAGYAPEISFFSERHFAAGYPYFAWGYWDSEQRQAEAVERLERESVPIYLVKVDRVSYVTRLYPTIDRHLNTRYQPLEPSSLPDHIRSEWAVMVDQSAVPVRTYEPLGTPCFR